MKRRGFKRFMGWLGAVCLLSASCSKPVDPDSGVYGNTVRVAVLPDSGVGAFKISFSHDPLAWTAPADEIILYNVYRRSAASGSTTLLTRSFGAAAPGLTAGRTYLYRDALGKIDPVPYSGDDFIIDTLNRRTTEAYEYGVSAMTALTRENDSTFTLGLNGEVAYFPRQVSGGFRVELLIDGGDALYTTDRAVILSGQFDTTGVETLVVSRFTDRLTDTVAGRVDKVSRASWPAYFDSLQIYDGGRAAYVRRDTLPLGAGNKRVVLTPIGNSTRITFTPLSKIIAVTPYAASVDIDLSYPGFRTRTKEDLKMVCMLDDDLPVRFNTYSDSSFSDSIPVYVWIATRNLNSTFFKTVSNLASPEIIGPLDTAWYPSGKGVRRYYSSCLYESRPETLTLDNYGQASALLRVSDTMPFRVSPLARVNGLGITGVPTDKVSLMADVISAPFPAKPGSLLGHNALNEFKPVTIQGTKFVLESWHDAGVSGRHRDSLAEWFLSYDSAPYIPPFRHLPANTFSAFSGYKEFVIVALTYGRFFGEPRVFLSKFTTPYTYVWDKVPPHITWSTQYDPRTKSIYAPMYYRDPANSSNDRVTDLSPLNYLFDVHLLTDGLTGLEAGIRDPGFGRIKSVSLALHYAGTVSQPALFDRDPLVNGRRYRDGTEVILFSLDEAQLSTQLDRKYAKNTRTGFTVPSAVFRSIDASAWRNGLWDMWIITEDDLGNKGMAPYGGDPSVVKTSFAMGSFMTRKIEVK